MSLTTPIRQARFQALAVMVWGSYLQTPWLLKFHLVSLEYMVIPQSSLQGLDAGSRCLSNLHSNRTALSNGCIGSSCCRFSLPLGSPEVFCCPLGPSRASEQIKSC